LPVATSGSCPHEIELIEGTPEEFALASAGAIYRPGSTSVIRHARLQNGADYIHWPGLFEFLIAPDGRRIAGRSFNEGNEDLLQTYVFGQVISYALLKQGMEPLHATVLAFDEGAVALLGDSGYGKSTLAAAFLQAGFRLVTDDMLVLRENGDRWLAYPGLPRLKLFPEPARLFLGSEATGRPMNPFTDKMIVPVAAKQWEGTPVPLRAIYLLPRPTFKSRSEKVTIRRRSKRQACMDLVANTFNSAIRTPGRLEQQFALATRLATTIPVKSLSYQRQFARLPKVVEAVRADLLKWRVEPAR